MDIAVPPKSEDETKKVESVASTASKPVDKLEEKPDDTAKAIDKVQEKADLKDEAFAKEEAERKKTAELIATKKFFLPIREKRSKPLLTLSFLPKKNKKVKKKVAKVSKVADTPRKKKSSSSQTILVVVLVVVLIGAVLAIDAGIIDIGVKLPFDLIKNV